MIRCPSGDQPGAGGKLRGTTGPSSSVQIVVDPSGGFGAVYRAEDILQSGKVVAIKQINLQGLSAQQKIEATDGFYREVRLLSGLKHPNLPAIHDSFADPEHWYIVMDFIEGETLETYLKQRFSGQQQPGLPLNEVLALGLQFCTVLDYLHTREPPIIFRDLKPANIMRTSTDQVYLIDFGIARHFIPGKPKDTIPFGSPGYASPEQYGRAQTTPQADLYSLGALLHHMLSGDDPAESPFRFAPLRLYGSPAMEELDQLIQRLVQVDASERPASAAEMKEVLQRLADIQAQAQPRLWRPPEEPLPLPPHYTTYTGWHSDGTGQQQRQQVAKPRLVFNRRRLISTGLKIGGTALVGYGIVQLAGSLFPLDGGFHGIVAVPYRPPPTPIPNYVFHKHTDAVTTVAWSPSGQLIASGSADKTVLVWRARDGVLLYTFTGYQSPVTSVTWSIDDMCVASSGDDDGSVQVWDSTDNKDIHSYKEQIGRVLALSWSFNKSLIASGGEDKSVRIWNANDGHPIMTLHGHTGSVCAVEWSSFGYPPPILASASADTTVRIWGGFFPQESVFRPNNIIYRGHSVGVNALAWLQDGRMMASASDDGTVQVWKAADGAHVFTYRGHKGPVNAVTWLRSYNSSGEVLWLASGGQDTTVQVWDLTGKLIATYRKHTKPIRSLASTRFTADMRIASASDDHTVRIWTVGQM